MKPGYIESGIPIVNHLGGDAFNMSNAEPAFEDTIGVLFARRQLGTAYPCSSPSRQNAPARKPVGSC